RLMPLERIRPAPNNRQAAPPNRIRASWSIKPFSRVVPLASLAQSPVSWRGEARDGVSGEETRDQPLDQGDGFAYRGPDRLAPAPMALGGAERRRLPARHQPRTGARP